MEEAGSTSLAVIQAHPADVAVQCEIKQNVGDTFQTLGPMDGDYFINPQLVLSRVSMTSDPSRAPVRFTLEQVGPGPL